jgi:hypothetical protein
MRDRKASAISASTTALNAPRDDRGQRGLAGRRHRRDDHRRGRQHSGGLCDQFADDSGARARDGLQLFGELQRRLLAFFRLLRQRAADNGRHALVKICAPVFGDVGRRRCQLHRHNLARVV